MSNRYWSKWGHWYEPNQIVGYRKHVYYIQGHHKGELSRVPVMDDEIDDLIYKLMRLKRKVEGE